MDAEVVGEPGVLRMEPPLVKAACDKAHALGMKVAAHVESPEGVRVALENGVDSIEHGAKPTRTSCGCSGNGARSRSPPFPPPCPTPCLTAASPMPPTSSRRTAGWYSRAS